MMLNFGLLFVNFRVRVYVLGFRMLRCFKGLGVGGVMLKFGFVVCQLKG